MATDREKEDIVRLVTTLDDGTSIIEHADGRLERMKSKTDWASLRAMTEEEIEAAARADPEWEGLLDIDWSKAVLVMPRRKEAISIRLDEDVLAFFKAERRAVEQRVHAIVEFGVEQGEQGHGGIV